MKDARNIFALVALAFSLGVYDVLKEWMNFSTVVALIVVLILFGFWLVAFLILNKFVFNKNAEATQGEQEIARKRIPADDAKGSRKADAKAGGASVAASSASVAKNQKKSGRSPQKPAEQKLPLEPAKLPEQTQPADQIQQDDQAQPAEQTQPEEQKTSVAQAEPVAWDRRAEQKKPIEWKIPSKPPRPIEWVIPAKPATPVAPMKPIEKEVSVEPQPPLDLRPQPSGLIAKLDAEKLAALDRIILDSCTTPGISGAAIVTHGGVLLVSTPFASSRKDISIAICASIFALGSRMSVDLGRERLKELVVRGDEGFLFLQDIADEAFLILIVKQDILIGGVIREAMRCAESAAFVLRG